MRICVYSTGPLSYFSIQYPDPHRNKERHMVTQELVEGLGLLLQPGGESSLPYAILW